MAWEENYGGMGEDYESEQNERRHKMGDALEAKGELTFKSDNGKSFKIDKDWYSAGEKVVPYLEKIEVGTQVEVTYFKNKAFRNVAKISSIAAPKKEVERNTQEDESTVEFTCEDCGKALKDGKYKKCFVCNKKTPVKEEVEKKSTNYSDDRSAQIMKGNSLNAAGAAVSGNFPGAQPMDIAEAMIIIARRGLDYLQE